MLSSNLGCVLGQVCSVFVTASASVASAAGKGKAARGTAGSSSRAAVAVAAKSAATKSSQQTRTATARSSQSLARVLSEGSRSEKAAEFVEISTNYCGGSDGSCEHLISMGRSVYGDCSGIDSCKESCQAWCDADADCTAFAISWPYYFCAVFKGLCDQKNSTDATLPSDTFNWSTDYWDSTHGTCYFSQEKYGPAAAGPADDACPAEYENAPRPDGDANLDAAPTDSDTGVIAITDVGTVAGCSQACDADDSCVAMETDAAKCVTYDNTFDDGGSKKAQYILCKRIPPAVLKIQKVAAFVTEGLAYLADNVVDGSTKIEDAVALSTAIAETKVAALKALADGL